jgi:arabinoxylan arabinofuranohydrolase
MNITAQTSTTRLLVAVTCLAAPASHGDHPIVQTCFTADPAPLVHDGTVNLYVGHDEDDACGFKMFDWNCFTSTGMVNWPDLRTGGGWVSQLNFSK